MCIYIYIYIYMYICMCVCIYVYTYYSGCNVRRRQATQRQNNCWKRSWNNLEPPKMKNTWESKTESWRRSPAALWNISQEISLQYLSQSTTVCRSVLQCVPDSSECLDIKAHADSSWNIYCNTFATHCDTLQRTATHCLLILHGT